MFHPAFEIDRCVMFDLKALVGATLSHQYPRARAHTQNKQTSFPKAKIVEKFETSVHKLLLKINSAKSNKPSLKGRAKQDLKYFENHSER